MSDYIPGNELTADSLSHAKTVSVLPPIVHLDRAFDYFKENYLEKEYVNDEFRQEILKGHRYVHNVSYGVTYRCSFKVAGQPQFANVVVKDLNDVVEALGLEFFDPQDLEPMKKSDLDKQDLLYFYYRKGNESIGSCAPRDDIVNKKVFKAAKKIDKNVAATPEWTAEAVLTPILHIYDTEEKKTVLCINLYNEQVGIDNLPLVPELENKVKTYTGVATLCKWILFLTVVGNQIVHPAVTGHFNFWTVLVALVMLFAAAVAGIATNSNRVGTRKRLIASPNAGFFAIQKGILITTIIFVAITVGLGFIPF